MDFEGNNSKIRWLLVKKQKTKKVGTIRWFLSEEEKTSKNFGWIFCWIFGKKKESIFWVKKRSEIVEQSLELC